MFQRLERIREVMTREELVKQKAQEFTSSGEFSPTLTECFITGADRGALLYVLRLIARC
jgi:hypothetical protein